MTETAVLLRRRGHPLTHGLSGHPLYDTWWNMLARCEDEHHAAYECYGGRGITVCREWHDVAVFIDWIEENLGPRPEGCSLDRVETYHGNYGPGEVRWATPKEQAENRRIPGGCPTQCIACPPARPSPPARPVRAYAPPGTKICTTCGPAEGLKSISEFYRKTRGGFENECKRCKKARTAAWVKANRATQ